MNVQRVAPGVLTLLLACFQVSSAQRPGDQPEGPAGTLKSTTRLVIVDVVATNSKGEPVADLRAQDFKVLENGREQDIRVFEFQHPESQRSDSVSASVVRPAKLPARTVSNAPAYKPGSSMNVVLLDLLNTANPRQNFARDEFLNFLKKLPAGGPVAIYVLTGNLRLVQDFTDDEATLRATVESLKGKGSALLDNPAAGPAMVVPLPGGTPPSIERSVRAREKESREFSTATQMELTLAALSSVARRLAPYSGRKNLIWVSDAFPFYINPRSAGLSEARGGYRMAASKADTVLMDSQVAIYPVDAHAVQVASMFDIGYGKIYGSDANNGGSNASGKDDFEERMGVHSTMNELAEETGGQAFYNSNSIEASLRNGMKDGSTYYTLGYYPQDKNWDGKFRRLSVKADRPGIRLRYRLGYYALEPTGLKKDQDGGRRANLREAMDPDSPVSSALLFQAMVLGPSEKTGNKVVVNFGIDPRALSFEKDADGLQHATLECAVEAYSEQGTLIGSEGTTIHAALPPESFARISKSYFPCQRELDLPAGSYRLRLGVVDNRTGLIGTANAAATVPAISAAKKP